jgi:hypothetical protein
VKTPKRKSAHDLLLIGRQYRDAKRKLSPEQFAQWRKERPELRHEARPDRVIVDLDRRLAALAAMPVAQKYKHKMPCTGVSTLRELSKFGNAALEALFEVDLFGPNTTRLQADVLYGLITGKPVAPRHKRKPKSKSKSGEGAP